MQNHLLAKEERNLSKYGIITYEIYAKHSNREPPNHIERINDIRNSDTDLHVLLDICQRYAEEIGADMESLLENLRKRFPNASVTLSNDERIHLWDIIKILSDNECSTHGTDVIRHLKEVIVFEQIGPRRTYRYADECSPLEEGKVTLLFRGPLFLFIIDELIGLLSIYDSEINGYVCSSPFSGIDYTIPMKHRVGEY